MRLSHLIFKDTSGIVVSTENGQHSGFYFLFLSLYSHTFKSQLVNVRGFHTLKGLAEGYVRVRISIQSFKHSLNPYPSEGLRVFPWPDPCRLNKLKIIRIGPKMKKI